MPIVRLTRSVTFSAAHRYYRPDWSDEQNRAAFGKCANDPGHGHTYRCAVTISGPIADDQSMVLDLLEFDRILSEEIIAPLDHQHINHAIPEFAYGRQLPTCEAMTVYIWGRLQPKLPANVSLERIRVDEDQNLFAEYDGENET